MDAAAKLALVLAAFDEERQRMGAVRGPLFRAVETIREDRPFNTEQIREIIDWLEDTHGKQFVAATDHLTQA